VLSGAGNWFKESLKSDINNLKKDPIGSINRTLDEWTIGQEARDRFRRGDVTGAIINSGIGNAFAAPELDRALRGKMTATDAAWILATYGTGGLLGKAKTAVKTGTRNKALQQIVKQAVK
jgi:hypothetical protein